jgi:hypothetical protein
MDEEHQCQQAGHLAVVGQRRVERPGEADRLLGQVGTDQGRSCRAGVALVEDQVQDRLARVIRRVTVCSG